MSRTVLDPVRRTGLDEALRRLRTLVSPYTGLVQATGELTSGPDDARLVRIGCSVADVRELTGTEGEFRPGGSDSSRDGALAAALGETAERYSACWLPSENLALASADELGSDAVAPERFALFRDDQYARERFPFRPFERSTRVRWTRGFSLPDGAPAWVPAQLVYLLRPETFASHETPIGYATSSGTACGATLEEAVLGGLLELVERDAFSLAWYNRLSLPRLDATGDPELVRHAGRYFDPAGLPYRTVDMSVFLGVPTVFAAVRAPAAPAGALGVGAASGVTVGDAWRRALSEAFAVRSWARSMRFEHSDRTFDAAFADVTGFDDHVLLYSDHEPAQHADFLDDSPEIRSTLEVSPLEGTTVRDWIEAVTRRLHAHGTSAYAVDVTAPDIRDAGLRVAKVVAPELCPLDAAYEARFLGGDRLYRAAFDLGLRDAPLAPDEVNAYPHPFP